MRDLLERIEDHAHNAPRTDGTTADYAYYAADTADLVAQLAREVDALKQKLNDGKEA